MAVVRSADQLSDVDISRIAREIARDLKPLQFVLDSAGISLDTFDRIQSSALFQQRLVEEVQIWTGSTKASLRERVATKAAIAIDELLGEAVELVRNTDVPGAARVQALQFIAKLGQLGDGATTKDDGSGRVMININIAGRKISFDKETAPEDQLKQVEGEFTTVTDVTPVVTPETPS